MYAIFAYSWPFDKKNVTSVIADAWFPRVTEPDRMFKQPVQQTLKAGDVRSRVSRCVVCMRAPHPRMEPLGGGDRSAQLPPQQQLRYRGK